MNQTLKISVGNIFSRSKVHVFAKFVLPPPNFLSEYDKKNLLTNYLEALKTRSIFVLVLDLKDKMQALHLESNVLIVLKLVSYTFLPFIQQILGLYQLFSSK
jgi:hypothetical protein